MRNYYIKIGKIISLLILSAIISMMISGCGGILDNIKNSISDNTSSYKIEGKWVYNGNPYISIEFSNDGTYNILEEGILSSGIKYGTYEIEKDTIVCNASDKSSTKYMIKEYKMARIDGDYISFSAEGNVYIGTFDNDGNFTKGTSISDTEIEEGTFAYSTEQKKAYLKEGKRTYDGYVEDGTFDEIGDLIKGKRSHYSPNGEIINCMEEGIFNDGYFIEGKRIWYAVDKDTFDAEIIEEGTFGDVEWLEKGVYIVNIYKDSKKIDSFTYEGVFDGLYNSVIGKRTYNGKIEEGTFDVEEWLFNEDYWINDEYYK